MQWELLLDTYESMSEYVCIQSIKKGAKVLSACLSIKTQR